MLVPRRVSVFFPSTLASQVFGTSSVVRQKVVSSRILIFFLKVGFLKDHHGWVSFTCFLKMFVKGTLSNPVNPVQV